MESARQYRIQRMVPQGELGELYLAQQVADSHSVLLRRLARQEVRRPGPAAKILRQALSVVGMGHTNLAPVLAIGESGGSYFVVSEHVQGLSLDRLLRTTEGTLSAPVALSVAHGVALGLEFLHDRQATGLALDVVHGGLCPAGILLSVAGEAKISPIGTAGAPPVERGSTLTPAWVEGPDAPEAALPAIGNLLLLMLLGSVSPSSHTGIPAQLQAFPPEVSKLVMRTLEEDSERRFRSLAAMRQGLAAQLDPSDEATARLGRLVGRAISTDATLRAEDGYPELFKPGSQAVTGSDPTLPALQAMDDGDDGLEADSCQTLTLQLVAGARPPTDPGVRGAPEWTDATPAEPSTPITDRRALVPNMRPPETPPSPELDPAPSAELDLAHAQAASEWQTTLGTSPATIAPAVRRRRTLRPLLSFVIVLILAAAGGAVAWHLVRSSSRKVAAPAMVDLGAPPTPVATPLRDAARDAGAAGAPATTGAATTATATAPAETPPPASDASPGSRRVTISSYPPSVLFLDGKRLGPIPQQVEIPPGATEPLRLRFLNLARGIRIKRELDPATERRAIKYRFVEGQLAFHLPEEVEVELDGKALEPRPSTVRVYEGRHKVVLRHDGKRRVKWVEVDPRKTAHVRSR